MKRKLRLFLQLSFLQLTSLAGASDSFAANFPAHVEYDPSARALSIDRKISGKITDENGQGLPGVNVAIKGTTRGTSSDVNGLYTLESVDDENVLVFSFVGYLAKEM